MSGSPGLAGRPSCSTRRAFCPPSSSQRRVTLGGLGSSLGKLGGFLVCMTQTAGRLAHVWQETMSSAELEIDHFIAQVLLGEPSLPISVRLLDSTQREFVVGDGTAVVAGPAVAGKLRIVCARLAVLFGAASPYGGEAEASVTLGSVNTRAVLEFINTAGRASFAIRRRSS
jgi:hypothetical protein